MTYGTLIAQTGARVGISTGDGTYGELTALVVAAVQKLDTLKPSGWNWQRVTGNITTVAGTETYAFSAIATALSVPTIRKIIEVRTAVPATGSTSQWALKRVSRTEADARYPMTASAISQVWWAEGLTLGLRPVPNDAYTLRISAVRGEITTGSPNMPVEFQDAIVEQAAELYFRARHNIAEAQAASAAVAEWRKIMLAADRPYTGAGRVTVESDDWG